MSTVAAVRFPLGHVLVTSDDKGHVRRVEFDLRLGGARPPSASPLAAAVGEYLSGRRADLEAPIDFQDASPFAVSVWEAVRSIPYGSTATYGQVAGMVGRKGAARAVGQALKANPVPLYVPCHRVVSASGMGGFSSGLPLKRWLLEMEARCREGAPAEGPLGEGPG